MSAHIACDKCRLVIGEIQSKSAAKRVKLSLFSDGSKYLEKDCFDLCTSCEARFEEWIHDARA